MKRQRFTGVVAGAGFQRLSISGFELSKERSGTKLNRGQTLGVRAEI
jgi:hypothetical protein